MFDRLPDVIIDQLFVQIINEKDICNFETRMQNRFLRQKVIMKFVRGDVFFHKFVKLEFRVDLVANLRISREQTSESCRKTVKMFLRI